MMSQEKLWESLKILSDSTAWEQLESWERAMNPWEREALRTVQEFIAKGEDA